MQVAQPYLNQSGQHFPASNPQSYYPTQSYIDPRAALQQNIPSHTSLPSNSQSYYPDRSYPNQYAHQNRSNITEHNRTQYINPGYQYDYHPGYYNNPDARYHERIQYNTHSNQNRYPQGSIPTRINQAPLQQQAIRNPNAPKVKQIVYQQQPLNIPQPVRNVQYIPHLNRYMDYVEERIKVPIQKYYTDYYQVEHITDFVPRQYEDTVVQMVPQQIIRYRLQYVPVERKIVHLPKNQVYDQNGLFKGVGNLADRAQIDSAALGLLGTGNNGEGQINRMLYQNLSNQQKRGLDESLVNKITKDQGNINKALYQGLKGQLGSPNRNISSPSRNIQQNIIRGVGGLVGGYSQVDQSRNTGGYSNLPQNQMIDRQMYQAMSQNLLSQKSKTSRRKTNYVTSDGYFPNYEDELRNLDSSVNISRAQYFNQNYAQNTASRLGRNNPTSGDRLAYMLGGLDGSRNY